MSKDKVNTKTHYGKGSRRRKRDKRCSLEEFLKNWERAFGSKNKTKK